MPAIFGMLLWLPTAAGAQTASDQAMSILAQASSGPLRCEIRRDASSGAVGLSGIVIGSRPVSGKFRFAVMKSGPAGSSNIAQGNRFDSDADIERLVGHVQTRLEQGAHVIVDLSVQTDDGLECQVTAPLQG